MTNNATLVGRLTAHPELQTLPGTDRSVLEIRLAVDRVGKDAPTDFIPVTFYGKHAELVAKYSAKGRRLAVAGRIQVDSWGPSDGRKYKTLIIAEKVEIIDFPPRVDDAEDVAEQAPIAA